MLRTLRIIYASDTESVKLDSYRLRDVAVHWYNTWMSSKGANSPPPEWQEFLDAFLRHYFPPEALRARADKFLNLRQRNMSAQEYSLRFNSLARYAPAMVPDMGDRVHRFVSGLGPHLIKECLTTSLQDGMYIARIQAHAQNLEEQQQPQRGERDSDKGHSKRARSSRAVGILSVSSHDVYVLIDSSSTLSYITPYIANRIRVKPEPIKPFEVSTPVGEPVVDRPVYRNCVVVICNHHTMADLHELKMLDFDFIMGIDWLACYTNVDCRTKMVRFQFLGEPLLEWKDVFLDELPNLPLEREIEFTIDVLLDTKAISIPPYRMAHAELKELKAQLKDLLEKGFIRPSPSP
ncbi:uncharacterized protein LOC132042591 [Lycium ferocissimum]|uniref:uncharacterized protein LOC132042591 n=1 Tax=Lycium ferocissimum TaxID=112874 RepID=UPI0028163CE1|nr:uncharacterized protein LOC132042591 [Lycium ferocissimum]